MKAPLSINPEQTPCFSQGKAEGLIFMLRASNNKND
jgi:hypothetical protein